MESRHVYERRAFLAALVFFGIAFLFLLRPVMVPVFLGIIITILCYPIYGFFLKFFRNRAYLASFVVTFLIFLCLVLPATLVTALVINEAYSFVAQMNVGKFFNFLFSQEFYRDYAEPVVAGLSRRFRVSLDLPALVTRLGSEAAQTVTKFSPQVLLQTATFIFGFFVMHFTIFFLFIEGKKVAHTILDLSPLARGYEDRLTGEFKNMIHATIYGFLVTALVQGILAGFGFWLAGIQAPLVFGTLTFCFSLVPIVGAAAVWIPMALWLFLTGEIKWGIFMVTYGALVISGIDNFIKPMIMRGKAKIHVLLIFFSLLGGITLFGPIGLLFGPVITALFLACIRIYREDFLNPTTI